MKKIDWQFNHELIGKRVYYTGENNPSIPLGKLGTVIAFRKPLGKGKQFSASVKIKPDNQDSINYETAYPFTTWALWPECPDCGSQKLNAPPTMPDGMIFVCRDCGNWF